MALVEVPIRALSKAKTLPFDLFDSGGRLLAKRGVHLADLKLNDFHFIGYYVDEIELLNWKRQINLQLVKLIDKPSTTIGQLSSLDLHFKSKLQDDLEHQSLTSRQIHQINTLYDWFDVWKTIERPSIDSSPTEVWKLAVRSRRVLSSQLQISIFCSNFWAHTSYRSSKVSSLLLLCALGVDILNDYSTEVELDFAQNYFVYFVLFCARLESLSVDLDTGVPDPFINFINYVVPCFSDSSDWSDKKLSSSVEYVYFVLIACCKYLSDSDALDMSLLSYSKALRYLSKEPLNESNLLKIYKALRSKYEGLIPGDLVVSRDGRVGVLIKYTTAATYFVKLFDATGLPLLEPRLEVVKLPVSQAVSKAKGMKLRASFDLNRIVACGFI